MRQHASTWDHEKFNYRVQKAEKAYISKKTQENNLLNKSSYRIFTIRAQQTKKKNITSN